QLMTAAGVRHTMRGLVHLYAADRARALPYAERAAAVLRLARHYLASARSVAAAMRYPPAGPRISVDELSEFGADLDGPDEAAAWLCAEADNVLATAERTLTLGPDGARVTIALAAALTPGYERLHRFATASSLTALARRGLPVPSTDLSSAGRSSPDLSSAGLPASATPV